MDNPSKGGFCGGVRWRQLSLDQVEVGRGSDGPNITQPKGLKCCAEIEAWQWVSPSGVGSLPAYSRASAGTGRNDTVAEAKPTTLKRPSPGDGFESHMYPIELK